MSIPTIGMKNPAAVIRDVKARLPEIKSLTVVVIYDDDSSDVFASQDPCEIERSAIVLMRTAIDFQGEGDFNEVS